MGKINAEHKTLEPETGSVNGGMFSDSGPAPSGEYHLLKLKIFLSTV